jgi:pimeloyl-ACP methyl ester carboxylesterase
MAQIDAIAHKASGPVETVRLANCSHSAHRDQPDQVLDAIAKFIEARGHAASI